MTNNMKKNRPMWFQVLWVILGILYIPIFLASWLLNVVSRTFLAISYYGMLDYLRGKNVFKSLFQWNSVL